MVNYGVVEINESEVSGNLSNIYVVLETVEGIDSFIIQCEEGGIDANTANGVLVYLEMCENIPQKLITALELAASR